MTLGASPLAAPAPTPARGLDCKLEHGCRVLSRARLEYRDGAEGRVLQVLREASDLSSYSDELALRANNWPERYHLSPARANLLRALCLDPGARVLEVGAGCGAITRYLGEQCALVDALEPMPARARAARARTRDLGSVEVFVGLLEDLPQEPAYDLVVVIGVLEYAGAGSPEIAPYRRLLEQARDRLRPGGALVLAIENQLGVKYLAGGAEDHSGRPFDSLEGYPLGAPARTFARSQLDRMLRQAGLEPLFLGAFPDYKLTEVLLSDRIFTLEPDLARRLPRFPSQDWAAPGRRAASEGALWSTLVAAGLGPATVNSFVVLASSPGAPGLWPPARVAAGYELTRRAAYATERVVVEGEAGLSFERRRLNPGREPAPGPAGVRLEIGEGSRGLVRGRDLVDLLAVSDLPARRGWLERWLRLAEAELGARPGRPRIDVLPHNVVVTPEDQLVVVDSKWVTDACDLSGLSARCALLTAFRLAPRAEVRGWGARDTEQLALQLGALLGLAGDGGWLAPAVAAECRLQAQVGVGVGWPAEPQRLPEYLERLHWNELRRPLAQGPRNFGLELAEATARVAYLEGSLSWKLTRPLRATNALLRRARSRLRDLPGAGRRPGRRSRRGGRSGPRS